MNAGQRAMAVAMIYPDAEKVKRKGVGSSATKELGSGRLSMARTILKASNDLAERVGEG